MKKIVEKIEKKIDSPGIAKKLAAGLSASEINSLFIEVFNEKSRQLSAPEILFQFRNNRFVKPAVVNPAGYKELEINWLKKAEEINFTPIQLSPLTPFGTCSSVAPVDQNNIVTALRGTEIVSDATNVLALKMADEFREEIQNRLIKYCTTHRHVRAQSFDNPLFAAHFGLFCMASGGYDNGDFSFETENIKDHINFYLAQLSSAFDKKNIVVKVELDYKNENMNNKLKDMLNYFHNDFKIIFINKDDGNNYYQLCRFRINLNYKDNEINLADGGLVDWTQKLLQNKKSRYLISAIGLELLYKINEGMI